MSGGVIGMAAILAFVGEPMVTFLYDERYRGAGPIVTLISLGYLPVLIAMSYHNLPIAAGHSGRFAAMVGVLAVCQVTCLLGGVYWFGIGGAALAPGVAAIGFYPVMLYVIRPYRGWDPVHDGAYFAVCLGLFGAVVWLRWHSISDLFVAT